MRVSRALFFFCAILIIVGIYLLIPPTPFGAEINGVINPGYYGYRQIDVLKAGGISGSFSESNNEPVRIYILDSGQYNSFKATGSISSLIVTEGSSGRFSTTFQVPGTYYLIIRHGPGFEQSTQSVTVYYNLDGLNLTFLFTGLAALASGVSLGVGGSRFSQAELDRIARTRHMVPFWQPLQTQSRGTVSIAPQKVAEMSAPTNTPVSADSATQLLDRLQRLESEIQRMDAMRRNGKLVNLTLFEKEYTEKVEQADGIRQKLESHEHLVAS